MPEGCLERRHPLRFRQRIDTLSRSACGVLKPWSEKAQPLLALAGYITSRDR